MITTNGLLTHYRDQGREDQVSALEFFVEVVNANQGEDLNPIALCDDADVVLIPSKKSFYVTPDYNFN